MRVGDIGSNLTLVNEPGEVEALLESLNQQVGLELHGKRCGCRAFYVLATHGVYTHVYGAKNRAPNSADQVHLHIEPRTNR